MKTPRHVVASALTQRSLQVGVTPASRKQLAADIAAYLLAERRTGELESLLRDMMQQRADTGVVEVTAVSAYPLTDAVRTDITSRVQAIVPAAKEIIISHRHDDNLVAGVKLIFANQQLDLSVQGKLNHFKQLTASSESTRKER